MYFWQAKSIIRVIVLKLIEWDRFNVAFWYVPSPMGQVTSFPPAMSLGKFVQHYKAIADFQSQQIVVLSVNRGWIRGRIGSLRIKLVHGFHLKETQIVGISSSWFDKFTSYLIRGLLEETAGWCRGRWSSLWGCCGKSMQSTQRQIWTFYYPISRSRHSDCSGFSYAWCQLMRSWD